MLDNIKIKIIPNNFEYDIYTLVKAFYPDSEIEVLQDNEETDKNQRVDICVRFTKDTLSVLVSDKESKAEIDYSNRSETKNILKRTLYDALLPLKGEKLPWGTLTGIRPVRIPLTMMEEGASREEAEAHLRETYYVSDGKIKLACDVAELELSCLKDIDYKNGYSLYVGIPFCPSICLYCSFASHTVDKWEGKLDLYLDTVEKELAFYAKTMGKAPDSIYIGGGTPTTLSPERMDRLISDIERYFDVSKVREFTVEAGRPDTIDEEKLLVLRKHGITRISINPQTMNQKTLEVIGRRHTVEDLVEKYQLAKKLGFDNINMDLIVGLPGEDVEDMRHTLEEIIKLDPENVTIHSLAVKRAARLKLFKDKYQEMGMVNNNEIMNMTQELLAKAGYNPYYLYRQKNMAGNFENVGYAKAGYEGLYNILIMEEKQTILAAGAGSSTKRVYGDGRIERAVNVKDVKLYMETIDKIIEGKAALLE